MRSLLELYAPMLEAGPKGQTLNIKQLDSIDPNMVVAFDRDVASNYKNAQVRRGPGGDDGWEFIATAGGGKSWGYDGQKWVPFELGKSGQRGSKTGSKPDLGLPAYGVDTNRALASATDVFSQDFGSYQRTVSAACERAFGKGWASLIDSLYGPGTVKRLFTELWRNFWTDHEAAHEFAHFFDVAQQAAQGKRNTRQGTTTGNTPWFTLDAAHSEQMVGRYPAKIGPRYDVPVDADFAGWDLDWTPEANPYIRRHRVTDASYFAEISSTA